MHASTPLTARLAALAVAMVACGAAQAQIHTLKLGAAQYTTHEKTNGVTGVGIPPGADASIGNASTVLLAYEYTLTPNLGVEFVIGIPPKIKARATGSVAFLGEVLTAKNLAPTALLTYHFGQSGDRLRPYVGVGLNYTKFIGVTTPYGWDVKLSDSVGLAGHMGLDYAIDKQWGLYASVAATKVKSDLLAISGTVLQSTIDFKPIIFSAGLLFRF
jgi:outer membrane protein